MHLDGLGRQAEVAGNLLGLHVAGDQAQDLPLTGGKLHKRDKTRRLVHADKMVARSTAVQFQA